MTNSPKPDGYPDDNPKTAIGVSKVPLHYIPPVALVHLGLAMEDGGGKYGLMNWREFTVSSSVYYDAMLRHLMAWWDGEDAAPDSGVHHLGHVMACAAIILDAAETTRLNDDRPDIEGHVAELLARHAEARKAKLAKEPEHMGPTVPEPGPIIPIEPIDLPDFRKGLRELAAREAGVSPGELDLFGMRADKPPEDANNDDLKHWSRSNLPKPGTPLMRRGLRIKGSQIWFEDTPIGDFAHLTPSEQARLTDLVDAIDGEPHPVRWAANNAPEG